MNKNIVLTISGHQGTVDFNALKAAGIYGVMLKCTEGNAYVSPVFHSNYEAAKAAGLKVGAFHDLVSSGVIAAAKESRHFGATVQGLEFELPLAVMVDPALVHFERAEDGEPLTPTQGYNIINMFAQKLKEYGRPGIYEGRKLVIASTGEYFKKYFSDNDLTQYPRWLTNAVEATAYTEAVVLATYANSADVNGVARPVPVSLFYDPAQRAQANAFADLESKQPQAAAPDSGEALNVKRGSTIKIEKAENLTINII